jgi:hypothetical protein
VYEAEMLAVLVATGFAAASGTACADLEGVEDLLFFGGPFFPWFLGEGSVSEGEGSLFAYDWRTPSDAQPGVNPHGTGHFILSFAQLAEIWEKAGEPPVYVPDGPSVWPMWLEDCTNAAYEVLGPTFELPPSCSETSNGISCTEG